MGRLFKLKRGDRCNLPFRGFSAFDRPLSSSRWLIPVANFENFSNLFGRYCAINVGIAVRVEFIENGDVNYRLKGLSDDTCKPKKSEWVF